MKRIIFCILVCLQSPDYIFGQVCDSVPVMSLTELQTRHVDKRITNQFFEVTKCRVFRTYVSRNKIYCNPCFVGGQIKLDTSHRYLSLVILGPEFMELSIDSIPIKPIFETTNNFYYKIDFSKKDTATLNLEVWMPEGTPFSIESLGGSASLLEYRMLRNQAYSGKNGFFKAFLGGLAILAMVNLIWFFFNRDKYILIYSIYTILLFIYFFAVHIGRAIEVNDYLNQIVVLCLQPMFYLTYTYFIIYFLETKRNLPGLHIWLKRFVVFFLVSTVIIGLLYTFSSWPITHQFNNFYRYMSGAIGFYTVFYLMKNKTKYGSFIIVGGISILLGSLATLLFAKYQIKIGPIIPIHWMMAGTAIELFCFSAGIGFRTSENQTKKLEFQKALILEMKKNEQLLENKEEILKREIAEVRLQVESEMEEKLSAEYSMKELEIELQSLRTQMNPHFIFNSLNSIKSFIAKNERRVAADYLSKFAQLMRLILAHSKETTISLRKELEAIRIYVELEQMRFSNKFEFKLEIPEYLDLDAYNIQPLIIQPFVENAIWHGLMQKESSGTLDVRIDVKNDALQIEIEDDGVGRKKAMEYAEHRLIKKKSFGMQITKDRLMHYYRDKYELIIDDQYQNGVASGTIVRITLPLN